MINFNREKGFEIREIQPTNLEENLKMQNDCDVEIEHCREKNDVDGLAKIFTTKSLLQVQEIEIRMKMQTESN